MRQIIPAWSMIGACLGASSARAQALWVGNWFRVPEASHRSAHSFTIIRRQGGALRYDDGGSVFIIAPREKATPEPLLPAASTLTLDLTATSYAYEEIVAGKPVVRVEERLSSDGKRLIGRRLSIDKDGRERARELEAVRIGTGNGLTGAWRELPPPADATGSTAPRPVSPFWVITRDASSLTTWKIPQTGEVLYGAVDGRRHATFDAVELPGQTYTLQVLSPRHLRWSFYETGHLVERADERLSADGLLWTDLISKRAHPNEKDCFVYRRE